MRHGHLEPWLIILMSVGVLLVMVLAFDFLVAVLNAVASYGSKVAGAIGEKWSLMLRDAHTKGETPPNGSRRRKKRQMMRDRFAFLWQSAANGFNGMKQWSPIKARVLMSREERT